MSQIPISSAMTCAASLGFTDPFSGSKGWVDRFGDPGGLAVPRRRDDRREVGHLPRRHGDASPSRPTPARSARSTRAASRTRSCRSPASRTTRACGATTRGEAADAAAAARRAAASRPRVASQISDASSAMLIASERAVKEHKLRPRARIHHISVRADDPIFMLTAPIPATKRGAREGRHEEGATSISSRSTRRSRRSCSPGRRSSTGISRR